jgi:Fur family zinc uptake transcriptional regulator
MKKKSLGRAGKSDLARALADAERACQERALRLTAKRKRLMQTLFERPVPQSAYDLAEAYRQDHGEEIPVMSVYRILDAFMEAGITHKLRSTNNFIACRHIACDHPHAASQFLICDQCGLVQELEIADGELKQLDRKARAKGFYLGHKQFEMHGLCGRCHDKPSPKAVAG